MTGSGSGWFVTMHKEMSFLAFGIFQCEALRGQILKRRFTVLKESSFLWYKHSYLWQAHRSSYVQPVPCHTTSMAMSCFCYHPLLHVAADLLGFSQGFCVCSFPTALERLKSYHPVSRILYLPRICWPWPLLCPFLLECVFFSLSTSPRSLYCAHLNTNPRLLFTIVIKSQNHTTYNGHGDFTHICQEWGSWD